MGSFHIKDGLDSFCLYLTLMRHAIFVKKQVIREGGLLVVVKKRIALPPPLHLGVR